MGVFLTEQTACFILKGIVGNDGYIEKNDLDVVDTSMAFIWSDWGKQRLNMATTADYPTEILNRNLSNKI